MALPKRVGGADLQVKATSAACWKIFRPNDSERLTIAACPAIIEAVGGPEVNRVSAGVCLHKTQFDHAV